jgi:hypothetical protein
VKNFVVGQQYKYKGFGETAQGMDETTPFQA